MNAFDTRNTQPARITWATTPAIRQRIATGEVFDIVTASDEALDDFTRQQIKRAVLDAESVVYHRASSGLYIETLLKKLALYERIQQKTKRVDDGPAIMAQLIAGKYREIAFGAHGIGQRYGSGSNGV